MKSMIRSILGGALIMLLSGCQYISPNSIRLSDEATTITGEVQNPSVENGEVIIQNKDRYDQLISKIPDKTLLQEVQTDFFSHKISEAFLLDILAYLAKEKQFSKEVELAFSNIRIYLDNRTDTTLVMDEVYYPVANQLLLQFARSADDCTDIMGQMHLENLSFFKKDCEFQWYIGRALMGDIKRIPPYLKQYNSLFTSIETKTCNLSENYMCYLLSENKAYSSFASEVNQFMKPGTLQANNILKNIPPINMGYAIFHEKIYPLNQEVFINLAYDSAVQLSARQGNSSICEQMKNANNKQFCQDLNQENKKIYYKNLFEEFYKKLYLVEKKVD